MLDCNDSISVSLPLISDSIFDLDHYISCKDSYCFTYLGGCSEYIFILNALKPYFLTSFPNINVKISCKQAILNKIMDYDKEFILPYESTNMKNFGKVEEIKCNLLDNKHPLENMLDILNVKNIFKLKNKIKIKTAKIFPYANFPSKSLTEGQIKELEIILNKKNIKIINDDTLPETVYGVENYETYYYASKTLSATFINVNLGKNIIKRLYENVEFLNIGHK